MLINDLRTDEISGGVPDFGGTLTCNLANIKNKGLYYDVTLCYYCLYIYYTTGVWVYKM